MMASGFYLTIFAKDPTDVPVEYTRLGPHTILPYDEDQMLAQLATTPSCVLCFSSRGGMSSMEIAQTLRMNLPATPIYYIALDPKEFQKKELIKNGFSNAFLLPWENRELASAMKEEMLYSQIPKMKDYRPVKIIDMVPGTTLTFDTQIYLPTNNKFITFAREGEVISDERLAKLNERGQNTLFVHKNDFTLFREYTIDAFKTVGRVGLSATEKEARLKNGIRELVSEMFVQDAQTSTFGRSNLLLQELQEVVKTLIDEENPGYLAKIEQMVNQESDFYGHLSRVATYATLFGMALGLPKPFELGLAGLLHDIGLTALPPSVMTSAPEELTPESRAAYDQHPELSLSIIKLKRMVISERVQKAILQHHERLDGAGTPHQLNGRKITIEAQVIAIANEFDHLTTLKTNRIKLSPAEAIEQMLSAQTADPIRAGLGIELLKTLKDAYMKSKEFSDVE